VLRSEVWQLLTGAPKTKLVLLAIVDGRELVETELDQIEVDEALENLKALGIIEIGEKGWRFTQGRKKGGEPIDIELAKLMFERIVKLVPSAKEPYWPSWSDDLRLLRQIDGRSIREIEKLFMFANAHPFWGKNILSPRKLRKHWNRLQVERSQKDGRGSAVERALSPFARDAVGDAARSDGEGVREVRSLVRKPTDA
jgi:hypothetical protein